MLQGISSFGRGPLTNVLLTLLLANGTLYLGNFSWKELRPGLIRVQGRVENPSSVFSFDDVKVQIEAVSEEKTTRHVIPIGHLCRGPNGVSFDRNLSVPAGVTDVKARLLMK